MGGVYALWAGALSAIQDPLDDAFKETKWDKC